MSDLIKEARGITGQLLLYDYKIVIKRKGVIAFMNHGLKGDKEIPIRNITAVQFKKAGMINGYIQFSIGGSLESKRGIFAAQSDENSVSFNTWQQKPFIEIKEILDEKINRDDTVNPISDSDEIEKLHNLQEKGIITEEEFQAKKKQILGL